MGDHATPGTPEIIMYTQLLCGYCTAAKKLLRGRDVAFTEVGVTMDAGRRREMINRSGRRTVPQIFIDGRHIGGYDDLAELDRNGELDALLGADG